MLIKIVSNIKYSDVSYNYVNHLLKCPEQMESCTVFDFFNFFIITVFVFKLDGRSEDTKLINIRYTADSSLIQV